MQYFTPCAMSFCLMLLSSASDGVEPFEPTTPRDLGKLSFFDFNFGAEFIGRERSNCVQVAVLQSGRGARAQKGLPPSCEKAFHLFARSRGLEIQSRRSCSCDSPDERRPDSPCD